MITSEQQPLFTQNDPLAIQFLSRGGMGYMPQAQFLTPSEYGAFRTMPAARSNDFLNQDPGLFQSYLIRSRGALMGLPEYTFNTYNPVANQQLYMSQIRRSSYDQMAAMGASGASLAASLAMTAPFGFFPGLALGMVMPDMAAPFVNRVRDTRAMQNATMSRIVGGPDMNAVTGMGFNAAAAHDISRSMRLSAAEDVLFKQGDYQKLMQLGIEHGLFDYGSSASQYKDTLKKLRNSMTTFMEVVGSTDFKDIMKDMKRLQTMGASAGQFMGISRAENMYARMAGLNHADMVNTYGQQGALIYAQAGLNNYQGSLQAMSNAAAVTMAQRMGILKPSEIARFGGVSGMAQTLTQQDAQANTRVRDYLLSYLVNDSMTGLDENVDLMDLMTSPNPLQRMASRAGRTNDPSKMATFQANAAQLYGQAVDKYGQDNIIGVVAHAMGRSANIEDPRMAMQVGMQMLGYSPEMAQQKSTMMFNEDFQAQRQREARIHRQKMYEEHSLAQNPFRRFGRWIDTSITKVFENTFGEAARSYTNWQEKRDAEASGIAYTPNSTVEFSGDNLARKLRASGSLSENQSVDNVWTGTITNPEEFRKRIAGGIYGEHGGEGMDSISFRVGKNGVPTTRGRDGGGSSFGELQFRTDNTVAFIRSDADLKQRFKDAGFDVDADAAAVENTRRAIEFGNYSAASREDWAALERLQKAWGVVNKSEGFDSKYFTYGRKLNWDNGFMVTKGNEAFKNSEAWRRVLFPIANHAGGGGLNKILTKATENLDVEKLMTTAEGRKELLDKIYTTFTNTYSGFDNRYRKGGEQYQWSLAQLEGLAPENRDARTYQQREQERAQKRAKHYMDAIMREEGYSGMDLNYSLTVARSNEFSKDEALEELRKDLADSGLDDGQIITMLNRADVTSAGNASEIQDSIRRSVYRQLGPGVVGEAKGMELFNKNPQLMRDLMAVKYANASPEERVAMEKAASEYMVRVEKRKEEYNNQRTENTNSKPDYFMFDSLSREERDELRTMVSKDPDKLLRLPRIQEMLRSTSHIKDEKDRAEYERKIAAAAKSSGFSEEAIKKMLSQGNMRVEDLEALGISKADAEKYIAYGNKMYDGYFFKTGNRILMREDRLKKAGLGADDDITADYLEDQLTRHAFEQQQTLLRYGVKTMDELRDPKIMKRVQEDIGKYGTTEEKAWIRDIARGATAAEASANLKPLREGAAADSRSGAVAGTNDFEAMWSAMAKSHKPAASPTADAALKELPGVLTNLNTTLTNMDSTLKRLDKKAPSTSEKTVWNPFGG